MKDNANGLFALNPALFHGLRSRRAATAFDVPQRRVGSSHFLARTKDETHVAVLDKDALFCLLD